MKADMRFCPALEKRATQRPDAKFVEKVERPQQSPKHTHRAPRRSVERAGEHSEYRLRAGAGVSGQLEA